MNTLADTLALRVPLLGGFYQTSPFVMENANGMRLTTSVSFLAPTGRLLISLPRINTLCPDATVYSREGEVSGTTTIDLEFCNDYMPIGEGLNIRVAGVQIKDAAVEVMSIRDTDGDEQVDRVYVLESPPCA